MTRCIEGISALLFTSEKASPVILIKSPYNVNIVHGVAIPRATVKVMIRFSLYW